MCRGSAVIAVGKKLTTIHLPSASTELAVGDELGVHLLAHHLRVLKRDLDHYVARASLYITNTFCTHAVDGRAAELYPNADLRLPVAFS